jgi:membrane-associated phospholipid phosphatase
VTVTGWLVWGIPWILKLQSLGNWLTPPMKFFSFLGLEQFYVLVMPVLLWCVDVGLGLRVGMILLTSNMLASTLKIVFGLPRPYWISRQVQALSTERTYGLPSGHAMNAVTLWGRLAAAIRRRWALAAALTLMFLIPLSRIELGVHFPADVIAGWIFGGLILFAFSRYEKSVAARLERVSSMTRITAATIAPLALVVLALAARSARAGIGIPSTWVELAAAAAPGADPIDPLELGSLLAVGGIFLGFSLGGAMLVGWGGFRVEGPWSQRLTRFGVGLLGVIIIFIGLAAIFPSGPTVLATALRVFRYAFVGFWISYLAPRVFVWARLA